MPSDRLARLRNETVGMFLHGFDSYMRHGFPEDELRPVSCTPLTRGRDHHSNYGINDVLGNYSLTLLDSLSTLAILAGGSDSSPTSYVGAHALLDFQHGVEEFVRYYGDGRTGSTGRGLRAHGFDLDSKVQVFETVIRGVGGLLSAHLFAVGDLPIPGYDPHNDLLGPQDDMLEPVSIIWTGGFVYDGQLLRLAYDLAERLLPAFYTATGLSYPRVNLRHGIPFYLNSPLHRNCSTQTWTERESSPSAEEDVEVTETCSAGAGSLVLEFTVLSRLTGDSRFEQAAKRSFWAVWERRSPIGLIGNGIDAEGGHWIGHASGIGAGVDSFFEYALKSHILLSGLDDLPKANGTGSRLGGRPWLDPNSLYPPLPPEHDSADAFLSAWHQAHAAIKRHLYTESGHPHYVNGHIHTGSPMAQWIDSLGAFYPGLLALAGELDEAIEVQLLYTALWTRFAALPERWSIRDSAVESGIGWWPGRPEFIESTYHIYQATGDPWYLYVGEMVLEDIHHRCWAQCGWSGLQDVRTGEQTDRMESFFLGETVKYLYLLFDPDHPLNKLDAAFVFSTEGHPLIIPRRHRSTFQSGPLGGGGGRTYVKEAAKAPPLDTRRGFTNTCPLPPASLPLTGSATAARTDLFHAAALIDLHNTPNPRESELAAEDFDFDREPEPEPEEMVIAAAGTDADPDPPFMLLPPTRPQHGKQPNHTIFPWTLPLAMLPSDGTCAKPSERQLVKLDFPSPPLSQDGEDSPYFIPFFGSQVVRISNHRLSILDIRGTRMFLVMDEWDGEPVWRVHWINNTPLGRDEMVDIDADVLGPSFDPIFSRLRNQSVIEVIALLDEPAAPASVPAINLTGPSTTHDGSLLARPVGADELDNDDDEMPWPCSPVTELINLLDSLLDAVTSILEPLEPPLEFFSRPMELRRLTGSLPVGSGSALPPDVADAPSAESIIPSHSLLSTLPWTTVYAAGYACVGRLPDTAPRSHQVIVMRRGGCSLSDKLANIPSFYPRPHSLQLVVVVDEETADSDDGPLAGRPFLHEQTTPSGMTRLHPISMVLVSGPLGEYDRLAGSRALGIRRRYYVETHGVRVGNVHVT